MARSLGCLAGLLTFGALTAQPAMAMPGAPALFFPQPPSVLAFARSEAIAGSFPGALEWIVAPQQGVAPSEAPAHLSALPEPSARPSLALVTPQSSFTHAAQAVSPDRPDIFGSVALAVSRTPLDAQWRRASASRFDEAGPWSAMLVSIRSAPRADQLARVNAWVNAHIAFVEDRSQYGQNDHWATGVDSIRRGRGDCEDYALAKMQLLRAAGFSADDIYLSIVKDLVRRADHAVLVVRSEGRFLVLDNNTDRLVEAGANQDYRPVFTYSATQSWTHGYRRESYAALGAGVGTGASR
jgi:predicted transglutaminase-like cysteine proteinase